MADQGSENSAPRVVGSLEGSVKWFDNKLDMDILPTLPPRFSIK